MTTRAANIEFLISGITSATTGHPVAGGVAYFYAAGTTTPKYAYADKLKASGVYSYTLDAVGAAHLYGDGEYKVIIKDSDGNTVKTYDNVRLKHEVYVVQTISTTPYSQTTDHDMFLVDTSVGDITINALAAASWDRPIKIMRTAGANNIIFTPNGSETLDGNANLTISSDAIVEIVSDGSNLRSVGFRANLFDRDNDTGVEPERTPDVDKVYVKTGGADRVVIDEGGLDVISGDLTVGGVSITGIVDASGAIAAHDAVTTAHSATATPTASRIAMFTADARLQSGSAPSGATEVVRKTDLESGTYTLSNKTLTSPVINTPKINEAVALTATATEINSAADGMGVTIPRQKIVEIGDWDMMSTSYANVPAGIPQNKIVGVRGMIVNDSGAVKHEIPPRTESASLPDAYIGAITGGSVNIVVKPGGIFDDTSYISTPYNRGWIILDYID